MPSVRKKATKREHRKVSAAPPPKPSRPSKEPFSSPGWVAPKRNPNNPPIDKPEHGGIDPASVLKTFERISGLSTPDALSPGSSVSHAARKVLAEEAENLAKQAKKNLSPKGVGGMKSNQPPTWDEGKAALAVTALPDAAAAIDLAPKVSTKLAQTASDLLDAAKAAPAKTAAKAAQKAQDVRTAPARAATKARALPREAKQAASSPAGRKAAAKGAGRTAARHPVRTGYAGALAIPSGAVPGDVGKRARAFAVGTADAFLNDPGKVAGTTAKGALGAFTPVLALGGAAVESVKQGSATPLEQTAGHLFYTPPVPKSKGGSGRPGGVLGMGESLFSGNPKTVQETTEEETGATPFIPAGAIARRLKQTDAYTGLRSNIRSGVEARRATTRDARAQAQEAAYQSGASRHGLKPPKPPVHDTRTGEPVVMRRVGKFANKQRGRHAASRSASRVSSKSHNWSTAEARPIIKELRKSKLVPREKIRSGSAAPPHAANAIAFMAKHGLGPDEQVGVAATKEALASYGKPEFGATPVDAFVDRDAAQWILDHPKIWHDQHFWKAVSLFKHSSKKLQTSEHAPWLPSNDNIVNPRRVREGLGPILKPWERNRPETDALLSQLFPEHGAQWTRKDAYDVMEGMRKEAAEASPAAEPHLPSSAEKLLKSRGLKQTRLRDHQAHQAWAEAMRELAAEKEHLAKGQDMLRNFKAGGKPTNTFDFENRVRESADRVKEKEAQVLEAQEAAGIASGELKRALTSRPLPQAGLGPDPAVLKSKVRRLEKTMQGPNKKSGLMKPPEHGGPAHGVTTTQTMPYTRKMVSDFVGEMRGEHKRMGLDEPAGYVANKLPKLVADAGRAREYAHPGGKVWPSQGIAASSGNALSDFGSTFQHSIHAPRAARAMNHEVSVGLDSHTRVVAGRRYHTEKQLEHLYNTGGVPEGLIPVDTQMLKGPLTGEHMSTPEGISPEEYTAILKGEFEHGNRFKNTAGQDLRKEILASAAAGTKGKKYALVDEGYMKESVAQLEKINGVSQGLAKLSNLSTGIILNSPGFAAIQIAQEGIPMLAAAGKNARYLGSAVRAVREGRKFDPEVEAQIKAVSGSSAGLAGSPWISDPIKAAAPKALWRHAWEVVNGKKISTIEKKRSGYFRELAASMKVEGDFHAWRKGARNLFKEIEGATEAMKGMTPGERLAYTASHPKLADKLQVAGNEWLGNWNSFTHFEKSVAPVTIFYSFQRYAAMWMLWHFPLNHPVAATALAMLGEQNANELEELAASEGGKVSNPLHFTEPVVVTGKGPVTSKNAFTLPAGKRAFPGLNAAGEAIASGNPAQLTGMLQPPIQIVDSAIRGVDPFTGQPIKGNPFAYIAKQLVSQSPLMRLLKVPSKLPGQPEQSSISKAFEKLQQGSTARSAYAVTSGQSGRNFGLESKLETALKTAAANSTEKREDLARAGKLPERRKERMEELGDKANKEIGEVLQALGLKAEDEQNYERFKEQFYGLSQQAKLEKELGLEPAPSEAKLEEELGLEPAPTAKQLEKELGLR